MGHNAIRRRSPETRIDCGCSRVRADSSCLPGESDGTWMAKLFCCRLCRIEIEPIALADGMVALVCVDCDLIGLAHEVAEGGRMWPAGFRGQVARRAPPPRATPTPPRCWRPWGSAPT